MVIKVIKNSDFIFLHRQEIASCAILNDRLNAIYFTLRFFVNEDSGNEVLPRGNPNRRTADDFY